MIGRVRDCDSPCARRILAEEAFEAADWILYLPTGSGRCVNLEQTALWRSYREAAQSGEVLDYYYDEYKKARRFARRWLEHPYETEVDGPDYKTKRYAYALSGKPLPEWLDETLLVPRLEAVVTAYCNMLITILDYAGEYGLAAADDDTKRKELFVVNVPPVMPSEEFLTPEIGQVIPVLDQTCAMLTQQSLVIALTEKTKEWVKGDPELADTLLDKKKSLEECIRYIMEKAAAVAKTNAEAMTKEQLESMQQEVHGRKAFMAGFAITADQVYKWAEDYYFNPDVKPSNVTTSAGKKTPEKTGSKTGSKGKAGSKTAPDAKAKATGDTGSKPAGSSSPGAPASVEGDAIETVEQTSLFGAEKAA